jgi:hypothetical protein
MRQIIRVDSTDKKTNESVHRKWFVVCMPITATSSTGKISASVDVGGPAAFVSFESEDI